MCNWWFLSFKLLNRLLHSDASCIEMKWGVDESTNKRWKYKSFSNDHGDYDRVYEFEMKLKMVGLAREKVGVFRCFVKLSPKLIAFDFMRKIGALNRQAQGQPVNLPTIVIFHDIIKWDLNICVEHNVKLLSENGINFSSGFFASRRLFAGFGDIKMSYND